MKKREITIDDITNKSWKRFWRYAKKILLALYDKYPEFLTSVEIQDLNPIDLDISCFVQDKDCKKACVYLLEKKYIKEEERGKFYLDTAGFGVVALIKAK